MNYWVELTEKSQIVLNVKVFKPISVSNPLPSGVTRGSTSFLKLFRTHPAAKQKQKQTEEEFCFVLKPNINDTLWHASAQDNSPLL